MFDAWLMLRLLGVYVKFNLVLMAIFQILAPINSHYPIAFG